MAGLDPQRIVKCCKNLRHLGPDLFLLSRPRDMLTVRICHPD